MLLQSCDSAHLVAAKRGDILERIKKFVLSASPKTGPVKSRIFGLI
jgi:hypothetical protein